MIHIPQVYGATPFNSDNDEDPMEADDGPYAGLGKRRRNPDTRPILKAALNQEHKRRRADQEMSIPIALSSKRKRESMDEDTLQANKRVANTEDGECKAETEHVISGESRVKLCKIVNNGDPQLVYGDDDRKFSSLGLACGKVEYYIDEYGISGVDIDDEYYFVTIPDPLKDIHQKAFQMTECSEVFKLLQSELMKRVRRDSISGELCHEMRRKMCQAYSSAASVIIPRLLTISEEASMEMI
ncbi:hypothetical protein FOZ61_004739 [Perkinsus olseni]|uniref:Uncharacterized protein n=1 Tax=Perkinsus olseni TaxID=32597 RepID=A0A7J6LYJ0_PEROL|nr:hypothetical protein FOZ61_004739 [Perkinsus olseni]KAF4664358.1 hypothetical protein FOL46_004287 [Perkinsus olseni]